MDNTYAVEKYMNIENMFKAKNKTADARFLYQDIKLVYHKCGYVISICLFDYLSNALLKMVR